MKNKLISAILVVMLLCSSVAVLSFAGGVKLGDVNKDGNIDASDARLALRASAQLETLDEEALVAADVNFTGKVTAADARLILRYAANLEEFPTEAESDTEYEEPSSEEPTSEEPTSEEPTTAEPDTGVIANEYPEIIDTFLSGKYYVDGYIVDGDEKSALKMATDGNDVELRSAIDNVDVAVMTKGSNLYLKFTGADDVNYYLDDAALNVIPNLNFTATDVLDGFIFEPVNKLIAPVLTKETIDDVEYSVYSFHKESGGYIIFYFDADETLVKINGKDADGNAQNGLLVNSLTAEMPEGVLTVDGYTAGTLLDLYGVIV